MDNSTTSNAEIKPLTHEDVKAAVRLLEDADKTPEGEMLSKIIHHCEAGEFNKALGVQADTRWNETQFFGIPVYADESIPFGEVHLINKAGEVFKKFKI